MSNTPSLSASDRISMLLDDSSFVEIGAYVTARNTDFNIQDKDTPKDGVITGYGVIDGNLVYVYSQDAKVLGGSIGEMHAKKIANLYDMAMKMGAPVIGLIDCAGLRLQEATDALNAFGEVFMKQTLASGVIPQITAIFGTCGGGAALIPNLTDVTFMTKEGAKLFVNSPNALDENRAEKLDTAAADYVAENTANVDAVYDTEAELLGAVRTMVGLLPSNNEDDGDCAVCEDDVNRIIPDLATKAGDVKAVIADITDDEFVFELKKNFADDVVTAFIRLNGETVGVVGNQKDVMTTAGAYKAEDFVPVMACPSQVDKIRNVSELEGTEIDQVFIGSCTNGRLEDFRAAAEVLKGKKVADFVKLIVTPASRKIYRQALADGTLDILAEAGAIITHPGCGLCCGRTGGILSDGERVVATNNRNFLGRMGTSKVEIYLASPRTAAACAVAGKIVNPE